jgi:hypothetical protein
MKTSVSVYKEHYTQICNSMPEHLTLVSANDYDVVDIFHNEYTQTQDKKNFGIKVASYMKGWWGDVLEGGLIQEGVSKEVARKVSVEFFDQQLPGFVSDRVDRYPEFYNTLGIKV